MKTPEQGGDTIVHAALDPDLVSWGQGLHLENHRPSRVSSWCQEQDHQEKADEEKLHFVFTLVVGVGPPPVIFRAV